MLPRIFLLGFFGFVSGSASWYNEFFWWLGKREVCYDGYGCFSTEHPFSNTEGLLPQTPETLNVTILLHTRTNPQQAIDVTDGIVQSFDSTKDNKVIIHGYMETIRDGWVNDMKNAFLEKDDVNVFLLDWGIAAGSLSYHQSIANSRLVAAITVKFLQNMIDNYRVDTTALHLVGFSLGAHLSGYIGSSIDGIGRITGLDPAGPYFQNTDTRVRLDPTDAEFVDVIHTDGDQLLNVELLPGFGTLQPMGHVDFYINGGSDQPGCATHVNDHLWSIIRGRFDPRRNLGCSHLRALDVFTESINSSCKFKSYPCTQSSLKTAICSTCGKGCTYMGHNASKSNGTGIYLTRTTGSSPFCKE